MRSNALLRQLRDANDAKDGAAGGRGENIPGVRLAVGDWPTRDTVEKVGGGGGVGL